MWKNAFFHFCTRIFAIEDLSKWHVSGHYYVFYIPDAFFFAVCFNRIAQINLTKRIFRHFQSRLWLYLVWESGMTNICVVMYTLFVIGAFCAVGLWKTLHRIDENVSSFKFSEEFAEQVHSSVEHIWRVHVAVSGTTVGRNSFPTEICRH